MRISSELAADLRWLADTEQWDEETRAEAKRSLKADPAFFCHFFAVLAQAKRAGYQFFDGGRFVRLDEFCASAGLPDPYHPARSEA